MKEQHYKYKLPYFVELKRNSERFAVDDYKERLLNMSPEVCSIFPHVEALPKLLLLNPALSSSAEPCFSALRMLKTYCSSTMGQT